MTWSDVHQIRYLPEDARRGMSLNGGVTRDCTVRQLNTDSNGAIYTNQLKTVKAWHYVCTVCMHACARARARACVCVCVCACVLDCVRDCVFECMYMCVYVCMYV